MNYSSSQTPSHSLNDLIGKQTPFLTCLNNVFDFCFHRQTLDGAFNPGLFSFRSIQPVQVSWSFSPFYWFVPWRYHSLYPWRKKNQKIAFESGRIMSRNYFQHNTLRNISFRANDDSGCILASNARVFRVLNSYWSHLIRSVNCPKAETIIYEKSATC